MRPLHEAVMNGHPMTSKVLIEHGANKDAVDNVRNCVHLYSILLATRSDSMLEELNLKM